LAAAAAAARSAVAAWNGDGVANGMAAAVVVPLALMSWSKPGGRRSPWPEGEGDGGASCWSIVKREKV
jgi:hypothetical protein